MIFRSQTAASASLKASAAAGIVKFQLQIQSSSKLRQKLYVIIINCTQTSVNLLQFYKWVPARYP
jgi:hypothetical protein